MLAMRKMHKNQAFSIAAVLVMSLLAIYVIFDPFHAGWSVPPFHPPVTHTVLFQFKQDANEDAIRNVGPRRSTPPYREGSSAWQMARKHD